MKILKFIGNFILKTFLFVIKEIFSFFIKFALLLFVLGMIVGGVISYTNREKNQVITKDSWIEIDLSNKYSEKIDPLPKFLKDGEENFYSLLTKLDSAKDDKNIEGIFIKLDNITLNNAQIEELGKKLESLQDYDKQVLAYATSMNNKNYSLALSSTMIAMPETMSANVNLTGYYSELTYYKGLADKLGVKFNVIHVGDYKAYGENYTKTEMSPEYRENISRLKDKIFDNFTDKISQKIGINKNLISERILAGDFMSSEPYQMKKFGLIDEFLYESDIKKAIGEDKLISLENYPLSSKSSKDKIAIIYAEGAILMGDEKTSLGNEITPDSISKELEKARKDEDIKGIVLRVNSPGGSALASNIIYHKIKEVSEEKPIYVSIGGVSASGGYYISSGAKKIFAENESITGSIGVVSLIPNLGELTKKLDLNIESVKKGEYSDLYSLTSDFSHDDEDKIYASSLKVYEEFLDVVATSRNLDRNYIHSIAQGKVWLGSEAKENGLVDNIGGLEDTISSLATDLELKEYSVVEIVEGQKFDKVMKKYLPYSKIFNKISNLESEKELYFKPSYFFPYNI